MIFFIRLKIFFISCLLLLSLLNRDEQWRHSIIFQTTPYPLLCFAHFTVHERPTQYHLSFRSKWMQIIAKTVSFPNGEKDVIYVCDEVSHSSVRGIQLIGHFPQMFPQIQTVCNPKKYSRLQIRFLENLSQVFSNKRTFSRLASCNIILVCLTDALLSLSTQSEWECH